MELKKVSDNISVVYDSMNLRVVSGPAGAGKTNYVLSKAIVSASEGNSVLLVNPEDDSVKDDGLLSAANKLQESSKFYHIKGKNLTVEKVMSIAAKLRVNYVVIDPLNLIRDTDCKMYEGSSLAINEIEKYAAKYNVYVISTLRESEVFV